MESSLHPARILFELNPGEPMRPTRGRVAAGIREHQGEHELTQGPHQGLIAVTRIDAKGLGAGDATLLS